MISDNAKKRGYYLPNALMDYFAEWCKPGRDYSVKIAGAILYFMTLPAGVRERAEKAAYSQDIEEAIIAMLTDIDEISADAAAETHNAAVRDAAKQARSRGRRTRPKEA